MGWYEALGAIGKGGLQGLDRFQVARQLDLENQNKLQQQKFSQQNQQYATEQHQRQLQLLDRALMKGDQEDFQSTHPIGSVLDDSGYQQAQDIGYGSLVKNTNPNNYVELPGLEQTKFDPTRIFQGTQDQQYTQQQHQGAAQQQYLTMLKTLGDLQDSQSKRDMLAKLASGQGGQGVDTNLDIPGYLATGSAHYNADTNPTVQTLDIEDPAHPGHHITIDARTRLPLQFGGQNVTQYHPPTAAQNTQAVLNDPKVERQLAAAEEAVVSGRMAPSQAVANFAKGLGQAAGGFARELSTRVLTNHPDFNYREAESNFAWGKATGTQSTVRYIKQVTDSLPILEKTAKALDLKGFKAMNIAELFAKGQMSDSDVSNFRLVHTLVGDEVAKILQGGGTGNQTSDTKLKQAFDALPETLTVEQWEGVVPLIKELFGKRLKNITEGTYMGKGGGPQAQTQVPQFDDAAHTVTIGGQAHQYSPENYVKIKADIQARMKGDKK